MKFKYNKKELEIFQEDIKRLRNKEIAYSDKIRFFKFLFNPIFYSNNNL